MEPVANLSLVWDNIPKLPVVYRVYEKKMTPSGQWDILEEITCITKITGLLRLSQ